MSVTVAVLAYNEAENLQGVIREVVGVLNGLPGHHEVVIIDDGSTDDTAFVARALASEMSMVRVVSHPFNRGLGDAYRSGIETATKAFLIFWPADGQFDPRIIREFSMVMDAQRLELVLGYLPNLKRGPLPALLSLGERCLYRLLFGRLPRFQGVFMVRRTLLPRLSLMSTGRGWGIVMELIIKASRNGWSVKSLPTDVRPRRDGRSKVITLSTVLSNLRQMATLRRII